MSDSLVRTFRITPPILWPDDTDSVYSEEKRLPLGDAVLDNARSIFGIVSGIDAEGVSWLEEILRRKPDFRCKMLIPLFPACVTRQEALGRLLDLERSKPNGIGFRLLLVDLRSGFPATAVCAVQDDNATVFALGPTQNLGLQGADSSHINVVVRCESAMLASFRRRFDDLWRGAVPLTPETTKIPRLVPIRGSAEGTILWQQYTDCCTGVALQAQRTANEPIREEDSSGGDLPVTQPASSSNGVPVAPNGAKREQTSLADLPGSGESTVNAGAATMSPIAEKDNRTAASASGEGSRLVQENATDNLGLPEVDAVAERVARLYQRGKLVGIDKGSRLKPLYVPVKAVWFGVESLRIVGSVRREVRYKISLFDKKHAAKIENARNSVSTLLSTFTYPLNDGIRWMPNTARELFRLECNRANSDGKALITSLVRGGPDAFVADQRKDIVAEANQMYREFHPGGSLSEWAIEEIITALKTRLKDAGGERLLPQVTYNSVEFSVEPEAEDISRWGQPATLLTAVAKFPRDAVTNRFFASGLGANPQQLIQAMDVCDDDLVKTLLAKGAWVVRNRAQAELDFIEKIEAANLSDHEKCRVLFELMDGAELDDIKKTLPSLVETAANETEG